MAGIVFQTSFDHYTTVTHRFQSVVTDGSSTASIGAFGRNSTNGISLLLANISSGNVRVARTLLAPLTEIWRGFSFETNILPVAGAARIFSEIRDAGLVQVFLRLLSDGTIQVLRGPVATPTLLGTLSGFVLLPNVQYHISIHTKISTTVGLVTVWVNEVSKLSLTGQNTQATGNNTCSEIVLVNAITVVTTAQSGAYHRFDDVVVRDDAQVLDLQVGAYFPTGIGATNQWTATGAATTREAVDEAAPNSDTDYMATAVVTDLSLFTFPTVPASSTIVAVAPLPFAKKTDAGTAKIKSVVRHGGTNYPGVEAAPSDGAYEYHPDILMVNPGTGVAWTAANWNAPVEIGVQRSA